MTRSDTSHALTWQLASLLLGYPDEEFHERLPLVEQASRALPRGPRERVQRFLDHVRAGSPAQLAADYVETFDLKRRCSLYLTYYAYGDTRKRGMALLRFKSAFRAAGLVLRDDELPDHLAVVLEFGATGDAPAMAQARRLLLEHRAGLELLRLALRDAASPYAEVVTAVTETLPPLAGTDQDAVGRLIAEGPPGAEEVGLQPFAPPEYMPSSPTGVRT